MKELLIVKTSESEKINNLLDQNNTDYEIVYQDTITSPKDLTEEELKKELAKRQEKRKIIELAHSYVTSLWNIEILREHIEEAEKENTLEAYWKLQDKLSRELANHLINYKGIDNATAFCLRLADILNGINI